MANRSQNLAELAQVKTLDFVAYATELGYELDAKESSRVVKVLRNSDGGKLLVKLGRDNHWVYRNERDYQQHGSLVDFCIAETGMSLNDARLHLLEWGRVDTSSHPVLPKVVNPESVRVSEEPDRPRMKAIWGAATWVPEHPYLLGRHIPSAVLNDGRFNRRWGLDKHGNCIFPSWDKQGICGLEFRGVAKKVFARGGKKGLWVSANVRDCLRLVITESPVDALSHYALYVDNADLLWPLGYACPGGSLGERSRELLASLMRQCAERGGEVLAATDNDPAGDEYAATLSALSPVVLSRILPLGKDWSEDLTQCSREAL